MSFEAYTSTFIIVKHFVKHTSRQAQCILTENLSFLGSFYIRSYDVIA